MATVAFIVVPEPGHVGPGIMIARGLAARGHRTYFSGFPDAAEHFTSHQQDFISVGDEVFPRGSLPHSIEIFTNRENLRKAIRFWSGPDPFAALPPPDLLVVETTFVPLAALAGHLAGLKVVSLSGVLPSP